MTGSNGTEGLKVRSLGELPREIQPGRDLWAGIEARLLAERAGPSARARTLMAEPGRFGKLRIMAAAAVLAALAVGMWIGRSVLPQLASGPGSGLTAVVSTSEPGALTANEPGALPAAYWTNQRYTSERAALVKSLEARMASLPPEARAKVVASLATINHSIQEIQTALGRDPGNALLQELLVNTYQDEMRVLTTVHEASAAGEGI